ncbi:MAG TPA: hypothetical protein GXX69_07395 [Firmicutes bacterium]|nr:hypothetical protein [Bacillota bacterium]
MSSLTEIKDWLSERPTWLQDAARRLVTYGDISDDDIEELVTLCKAEAGFEAIHIKPVVDIPLERFVPKKEKTCLRLDSISDIKGINALAPRKPLEFGKGPLTIIYGGNGSGKSGYVRLLKSACGARKVGRLLPNVFDRTKYEQGCVFHISDSAGCNEINWNANGGVDDRLACVEIYDADCASVYVNDENEVTYEPPELLLFNQLISICDRVKEVLRSEKDKLICKKPTLPDEYSSTESGAWYLQLDHTTKDEDIETKCRWSKTLEEELVGVRQRLAEHNPAEKAEAFIKKRDNITGLLDRLGKLRTRLGGEECRTYLAAKRDVASKRQAAEDDAKRVFEGALEGIGTDSWKHLWNSARDYSEKCAYPGKDFPYVEGDSKCVLCQQPLDESTKTRLQAFEDYVKGDLETKATIAESCLRKLTDELNDLFAVELKLATDAAGITEEPDRSNIREYYDQLKGRKNDLIQAMDESQIGPLPNKKILTIIQNLAKTLEEQAAG